MQVAAVVERQVRLVEQAVQVVVALAEQSLLHRHLARSILVAVAVDTATQHHQAQAVAALSSSLMLVHNVVLAEP